MCLDWVVWFGLSLVWMVWFGFSSLGFLVWPGLDYLEVVSMVFCLKVLGKSGGGP